MASSSEHQPVRIRRAASGEGWYFGDKFRDHSLYRDRIIARLPDLEGCMATDLQRALREEVRAGVVDPGVLLSADDDRYYDDEECSPYPLSFALHKNMLSLSFDFTTAVWAVPSRDSSDAQRFLDSDGWYDEEAAASSVLMGLLRPFLKRNHAELVSVAIDENYLTPPWRWKGQATVATRGRYVSEVLRVGLDAIALAEAFGQNGQLTRGIAADLVRGGHASALIGQPEGHWLDVKQQHYDLTGTVGKIKLAQAVAKFANAELGGVLIIGMAGKKIPGGEVIRKLSPVPIDGETLRKCRQVLADRLYPPPDLLSIEPIGEAGKGVVLIDVPPQPEELKPFLVHGAIVDGEADGTFISIVRRRGESSIPTTAPMIHATLAAGRALLRRGHVGDEGNRR
ncbi:ATP-binding protein [Mycolicibacterium peregrinum]|uniref:ATP-binding protein n=1 Tax=Mycolicibacterium peregrinum TaxID=43304 RepID=UPI0010423D41|nr:ATP-binding protein [Mycolicibacterium peregrinum]